ncbi:MAG: hypothetical protein ACLP5H_10110 [Desulfomonilaceae bacterium]
MDARKIVLDSIREATAAIDGLGSDNSRLMASRAIHINVLIRQVPGPQARFLKTIYNDIGAEAAISHQAYFEENEAVTDMIVMGTVYQHREVRRILTDNPKIHPWLEAIETVVENAPESRE